MRRLPMVVLTLAALVPSGALAGAAADSVTMTVRPTLLRANERAAASGIVNDARPDQLVTVQAKPCGETAWRDVAETFTAEGGGWAVDVAPGIGGVLRATSGGATSVPVKVQQRPSVSLVQRPPGTFTIWVNAQRSFWHRRVVLQRFDPGRRNWVDIRSVLLTDSGAPPGVPWVYSGTEKFRVKVAKRTLLRATLPLAQARPCYLAGYSNMMRR